MEYKRACASKTACPAGIATFGGFIIYLFVGRKCTFKMFSISKYVGSFKKATVQFLLLYLFL